MKRFFTRILVCLVPTFLSLGVAAWAYNEYENGRGGFRFGIDLVGGTILVYEVDEAKMPENFKAEDLAAALKRRIDPADLYNITIRPLPGTPPRVEIVLPTGGRHQAQAEERAWKRILSEAARKYPVAGQDDPYGDIRKIPDGRANLVDRITKLNPELDRAEVDRWVEQKVNPGGKERRTLTSEEVENIKNLIERQGRLEFRILANFNDDEDAINAAREYFKKPQVKTELALAEVRNEPPPGPRREDGSAFFPVKLTPPSEHTYSWIELGKSQLYQLRLNSDALAKNQAMLAEVEKYAKSGEPFTLPNAQGLYYVRTVTDWSRRLIKDREQGKSREFFVLVRDPLKGNEITGDYLVRAAEGFNNKGERTIDFTFNADGGNLFYDVTTRNKPTGSRETGFRRQLAIVFDGQIVSAPSLNEPIRTNGQISGDFTQQEINDMVRILRAGALPATLKKEPVSQNSMGATLGEDTIKKGTWSVGFAFVAVMAFMIFYYRFAGIVACLALLANLLLTVAFMVVVQAAFTLPGLAGLVLMLGMAVDANVLIYERLREERERGANLALALRNGYERAFPTILDTHLSSIFTAIVLYVVGNDQLKGFGISLTVGLIISLFTALYMTRTIFEIGLYKGWLKDLNFFGGLVRLIHSRYWDFMSIRYYWFTATAILTILGGSLFIYRLDRGGLNIDFVGGTAFTGRLTTPMSLTELRQQLDLESGRLEDATVEQIWVGSDQASSGDRSSYFTLRTSEKDARKVFDHVVAHLGDDLARIKLARYEVNPAGTEATLHFTDQGGKDPDYASPAQVQLMVSNAFAARDLSRSAFSVDRPADEKVMKDDRYSELKLRLNDPMKPDELKSILASVQSEFDRSPQPERLENFDSQLAATTRERALYAIVASWIAILLYLWFRFGSWTFGAAAVVCLIHDLLFTLGVIAACHYVYAAFGSVLGIQDFKIDLPTVAALLTLVGYSVNDTIVVFDRIREVRGKNPALTPQIINDSINQTLTRTLLASTTVFLVVLLLYIFGGEGVKLFAFVMVVGVVIGTYSSIYVASPLLLIFGEGRLTAAQAERARQEAAKA